MQILGRNTTPPHASNCARRPLAKRGSEGGAEADGKGASGRDRDVVRLADLQAEQVGAGEREREAVAELPGRGSAQVREALVATPVGAQVGGGRVGGSDVGQQGEPVV